MGLIYKTKSSKLDVAGNYSSGSAITIDAKFEIISLVAEAETVTAGNIQIGSTAIAEKSNLLVTAACSSNGNVTVTLNGVAFLVALTTADDTTTKVATKIRTATFTGYTTGGTGDNVEFLSSKFRAETDATYSEGTTGATGTMTTPIAGVDAINDIVDVTALPTVIGTKKQLLYIVNPDFPTTSARTIYIYISSAATVKLHITSQRIIE